MSHPLQTNCLQDTNTMQTASFRPKRTLVALSDPTSLAGKLDPAKGRKLHAQYIGTHMGLPNIPSTFDGLLHYTAVTPKGQRDKI